MGEFQAGMMAIAIIFVTIAICDAWLEIEIVKSECSQEVSDES